MRAGHGNQKTTTMTADTTPTYAQTLRRISNAIGALKPYWHDKGNVPDALSNELADAVMTAPPEHLRTFDQASPEAEVQELVQWAQSHTERRQHARFFELLKQLNSMDADTPECTALLMEAMHCAPPRFMDAAAEIAADFIPQATHVNEQGQPVYSVQEIAQHFGKTEEEVQDDMQRLIEDGRLGAACLHDGPVFPLQ